MKPTIAAVPHRRRRPLDEAQSRPRATRCSAAARDYAAHHAGCSRRVPSTSRRRPRRGLYGQRTGYHRVGAAQLGGGPVHSQEPCLTSGCNRVHGICAQGLLRHALVCGILRVFQSVHPAGGRSTSLPHALRRPAARVPGQLSRVRLGMRKTVCRIQSSRDPQDSAVDRLGFARSGQLRDWL